MITAIDTNILIDILEPDPEYGPASRDALKRCMREGALVACEVVWAEGATAYGRAVEKFVAAMEHMGIGFSPMIREAALKAAGCWHS